MMQSLVPALLLVLLLHCGLAVAQQTELVPEPGGTGVWTLDHRTIPPLQQVLLVLPQSSVMDFTRVRVAVRLQNADFGPPGNLVLNAGSSLATQLTITSNSSGTTYFYSYRQTGISTATLRLNNELGVRQEGGGGSCPYVASALSVSVRGSWGLCMLLVGVFARY